tara:strand:+ start:1628 stop:1828 length:201 start_codon:yes stop_codon:yes gene_type:complete
MTGVYPHANNLGEGEHRFFLPIYIFVLKFRLEKFERGIKRDLFSAFWKSSGKRPQKIRMGENQWKR